MKIAVPLSFRASSFLVLCLSSLQAAAPKLLDDQFNLPEGFHIYKAAGSELTGGSYDLVFDGEGRLLVGDGQKLRRLTDSDGDQVYDKFEILAEGLGGRGPQGLVVYGDHVYAVGGDGIQLFSGYLAGGKLKHERRLGEPFSTGGDHSAHTLLRGLDGYIYFVTGDGGGTTDRRHITEESSPVLFERKASVFRFDPAGKQWECIAAGGRNPPSLGMNYLGEFFSFDSDMEWHVDLPFYRPVRLNHWATGADLGWQSAGAYPRYYIDTIPGILDVGRGSPDWGIFYEHQQFPKKYRDAFLVCDYQWKSATSGGYANPGRLVAFHMDRVNATWHAKMTLLAQPKIGARDAKGKAINFGLVDVDVAPDGSIVMTDHNQGVWRMFYDPSPDPVIPSMVPEPVKDERSVLQKLLDLPQPMSEWSRTQEEVLIKSGGPEIWRRLEKAVFDGSLPLRSRLRALRLIAPRFRTLDEAFIEKLAQDSHQELRGQAAWLAGIRGKNEALAIRLLDDRDSFVKRRAAGALCRLATAKATPSLVRRLSDHDRGVRYSVMTALAHRPTPEIMAASEKEDSLRTLLRILVATNIRRERAKPEQVHGIITKLFDAGLEHPKAGSDYLDLLRVLGIFRPEILQSEALTKRVMESMLDDFPCRDERIRWEHVRLFGEYDQPAAFAPLLVLLEREADYPDQFHIADAISKLSRGWTDEESRRLVRWVQSTQTGWFSEFKGKGRQFPGFWGTVLKRIASKHGKAMVELADGIQPDSQLGQIAFKAIRSAPNADQVFLKAFQAAKDKAERKRLLTILSEINSPAVGVALLKEYRKSKDPVEREMLISALATQPLPAQELPLFLEAILELDSPNAIESCAKRIIADAQWLTKYGEAVKKWKLADYQGEQAVCFRFIELITAHPGSAPLLERALQTLFGRQRPNFRPQLQCIWSSDAQNEGEQVWFIKKFRVNAPRAASLRITCDNEFVVWINGKKVAQGNNWEKPQGLDVRDALKVGDNIIAVEGRNQGGPAGLAARLVWVGHEGPSGSIPTDTTWKLSTVKPPEGWQTKGTAVGSWRPATDVSKPTANVMKVMAGLWEKQLAVSPEAVAEYWQSWYRTRFRQPYTARVVAAGNVTVRSDEELHAAIAGMKEFSGDVGEGRQSYLKGGCFACHGGVGDKEGTLFGPALAGVTLRLNRNELADSLVYPSKQVSDRFKATEVKLKDGRTLSGFLTEQSETHVSVTDLQNKVTRVERKDVESVKAQETSLMPAKLLSAFTEEELKNLMAFIHGMK